jgi:non-heme chloroperoxidase
MAVTPEPFSLDGGGVRLAGERWVGDAAGEVVVLLHGGGQTRHSWARTAARLAGDGRIAVLLDARGHGDSQWHPAQDYTIDGFVDDLLAYVGTLDAPPVLVGASLGGITALVAAGEHPGLARGLVLVDVVVHLEPDGVRRIRDFMTARADGFASLQEVADAIAAYNPLRPRPRNLDGLRKNVRRHEDGRWHWHWDPAFMRNDDEPQRHLDRGRLVRAAQQITVPTLVVRGLQSDVVSDAGLARMRELIPHAQAVDVAAAGHMVAGDDNDVFATTLRAFLAGLDRDGATARPGTPPAPAATPPVAAPVRAEVVLDALAAIGATHVVTVPDTVQRSVLAALDARGAPPVIRAATELDVLGICAGLWMAGRRPVALIQQLGLFASANALRAFTHDQAVPLAILAGLFGREVTRAVDDRQPSAVRLCAPLLDALEIPWTLVEGPGDQAQIASGLARAFDEPGTSVVLIGAPTQ